MATKPKAVPPVISANHIPLTNRELYDLRDAITKFLASDTVVSLGFGAGLSKNLRIVKHAITDMESTIKLSEQMQEFEKRRMALIEKHGLKDQNNRPVIKGGNYELKDPDVFASEFKVLQEEFKEATDAHEKKQKAFDEGMNKDAEIELFYIPNKHWPKEMKACFSGLAPLIADLDGLEADMAK